MPKLLFRALLLTGATAVACAPATVNPTGQLTGAPSARLAVDHFMAAVRTGDLQAMTTFWGTSRGPTRDTMERDQLERRAIILQCFLAHDQFTIRSEYPGDGGRRLLGADLTRGNQTRPTTFTTIIGPGSRWYVEAVDMAALRDFCQAAGVQPTP